MASGWFVSKTSTHRASSKGAADEILGTLEAFGLHWDEDIIYQSQRTAAYEAAFHHLKEAGAIYPCACSRKEIADSALQLAMNWSIRARAAMELRMAERKGLAHNRR